MHLHFRDALAVLGPAILACACGDTAAPRPILTISPPSIMLLVCQEMPLTATVTPPSAGVVLYQSGDTAVATVSPAGVARGVRDGITQIRGWLATNSTVRDSVLVVVASPGPCPRP